VLAAFGTPAAQAQTYTVLHRFTGPDGYFPRAGLIADPAGSLFGTTYGGGAAGFGTVFRLDTTGLTVLNSFPGGADGAILSAGLIRDSAGNLYGTTWVGGESNRGTVFKLDTTGMETVLHSFKGGMDGVNPNAAPIRDSAGNLYGTTWKGGASNHENGTVFKMEKTGLRNLYLFTGGTDGANPNGGLIQDSAGNLYGTARHAGASGFGVVFKLDAAGTQTVLYAFKGGPDGGYPAAGLARDAAGNFYGTTESGGAGYGVVFKLDTTGTETALYRFTGGADGSNPAAGLVLDPAGDLYGATVGGGSNTAALGYGVVFKLDATGTETVLHTFSGGADGAQPFAGLFRDSAGNLYGTTANGGGGHNTACRAGCGVVFKIAP
jgi:uncharacterized repeat protein (TIGR03803 family)